MVIIVMGITAIGLISFRRWRWAIEVIYPAITVACIVLIFTYDIKGLIVAETMSRTKLGKQLWLMNLWGFQVTFFRTDYKTTLWRPFVLLAALVIVIFVHHGQFKPTNKEWSALYSYFTVGFLGELIHYRWMSEQVALFLKSEEAKLSELSMKSIFSEIPDAILVTSYTQPNKVRFYNQIFIQLLRILIKQPGVNYTEKFSEKMLTDCVFTPFKAQKSVRLD